MPGLAIAYSLQDIADHPADHPEPSFAHVITCMMLSAVDAFPLLSQGGIAHDAGIKLYYFCCSRREWWRSLQGRGF